MTVSSLVFVLTVFFISYITGYIFQLKYPIKLDFKRNETIDGLRGFLAISVFIHHTHIWYNYASTSRWEGPESTLFNQLGQVGVSFFFMISSFLFVKMILDSKEKINWLNFFIRRFLRLAPVHFLITAIIVVLVFVESNWFMNVGFYDLIVQIGKWLGFGLIGLDSINGFDPNIFNAGVLWSISYEWVLYFSIPILALILTPSKSTLPFAILGLVFIFFTLNFRGYETAHLLSLVGGAIAPVIIRFNKTKINFNSLWLSAVVFLLVLLVFRFHSAKMIECKILLVIIFTFIAMGNDLFGILKWNTLKFLGAISYSTYLLHGLVLFIAIKYIIGIENIASFSKINYSIFIFGLTPLIVVFSYLGYRFIEFPFIRMFKAHNRPNDQISK